MRELKCPHCKSVFQVDDDMYESIAGQVRNETFEAELDRRESELRDRIRSDYEVKSLKEHRIFSEKLVSLEKEISKKEKEISTLGERLRQSDKTKDLEIANEVERAKAETQRSLQAKEMEIATLKLQIANEESERKVILLEERRKTEELLKKKDDRISELNRELEIERRDAKLQMASIKEKHAIVISEKDKEIEYHKDFKARLSTKMLGETLEIHCQILFNQARSMGMFPEAYFEKDNDARGGSKGDFIFRDYVDGNEYISIMFEMKNEADTTATKHKNDDFLEKLDKDRNEKGCEYAVLVSMLERDNELYNEGIVNKSYLYPKMYVIRPQMFMTLIAILSQASRKSLGEIMLLKSELESARAQSVDVTNFEKRRDQFITSFGKLVEAHVKKHNDAMGGIDKVIEALEKQVDALKKVKALFETSEQKLVRANESVENDFTIKKLTHGNPTMRKKFEDARKQRDSGNEDSPMENSSLE